MYARIEACKLSPRSGCGIDYGGASYNDGYLAVSHATDNNSVYGGAIMNEHEAAVSGSIFTWNKALALYGSPDNAYGDAIYNDDDLYLTAAGSWPTAPPTRTIHPDLAGASLTWTSPSPEPVPARGPPI